MMRPLGKAADPQRDVEAERTGRGRLDVHRRAVGAKAHDRALAELPFDLCERAFQRLRLVHIPLAPEVEKVSHRHVVLLISQPHGSGNPCPCSPSVLALMSTKREQFNSILVVAVFPGFG
jgi:hypothetical protein